MKNEISKNFEIRSPGIGPTVRYLWERSQGSISLTLVWVCVVVFVAVELLDIVGIASRRQIVFFLGLSRIGIFGRLWIHQFLTAPLLHANVTHLLFNMLSLWILGPAVENALGRKRYIFFSILCAGCSMLGFLFINLSTSNIALGYSGVIFGILVAQAMYFPDNTILIFYFFAMKMKYAVLVLGAVELYLTISPQEGGIAHAAHIFGAAAAFVYLRIVQNQKAKAKRKNYLQHHTRPKLVGRKRYKEVPWEL